MSKDVVITDETVYPQHNHYEAMQRQAMQRRWLNQLIHAVMPKPKRPSIRALIATSTRYCRHGMV
jgi:hypothetical protein